MHQYKIKIRKELEQWQREMQKKPSISGKATKEFQTRINRMIPEKLHVLITKVVKNMTRTVLFGAGFTTASLETNTSLMDIENNVKDKISFYCSSAAVEGGITGFGGFVSGLADFPLWMSLKIKMLFEIATLYGFDTNDLKERIFILQVFEITFSSQINRNKVYENMQNWEKEKENFPSDINDFDWRNFQMEYRDHLDLAKLMQLIPGFGAIVGAYINHKYTKKLGKFAMNAYRMRRFNKERLQIMLP